MMNEAVQALPVVPALIAMSSDGRLVVASEGDAVRVAGGGVLGGSVIAMTIVEQTILAVSCERGEHVLRRFDRDGVEHGAAVALGALGAEVTIRACKGAALIEGERGVLVRDGAVEHLGARGRDRRVLLATRGVVERRGKTIVPLRAAACATLALPLDLANGVIGAGAALFDGAAAVIEVVVREGAIALIYDLRSGGLRSRIRLGAARLLAVADRAGIAVIGHGANVGLLDLRAGRCAGEHVLAASVAGATIDAAGKRIACIDVEGRVSEARVGDEASAPEIEHTTEEGPVVVAAVATPVVIEGAVERATPVIIEAIELAAPAVIEPVHLTALGAPAHPVLANAALEAYVDAMRTWVVHLARTAIALAPAVAAQAGLATTSTTSPEALALARTEEQAAVAAFAAWSGRGAPHVELAAELGLSPTATMILLLAAAPQIWGELARTYALCTADPARPIVDELLLAHLLEANAATRAAIGRELDDDAPLVRTGAIAVGRGLRPYAAITVHPAIARRLAGAAPAGDHGASVAARPLADLAPRAEIAALANALSTARDHGPVRVVLRGRARAGRRTIAASLAACAARRIGMVVADTAEPEVVRARLRDVALRGDLPCVAIEHASDPTALAKLRAVLDAHPGPLFVRAPLGGELPLSPGYLALELKPLTETERRDTWRAMLAQHAFDPALADELAARFSVGPGAMHRACAAAAGRGGGTETIVAVLRQQRAARIETIATRVDQLAAWEDLVVPPEIDDALRELISRARHRRTVLESWGMSSVASTARGLTALFQGGPGTGKTLAAGAIARALGYELWRVDLSKVVSKWIGETEKNLGAVFDAAEDGEIVLLFDEADSLFGRRTEVKSSNDRNANLETNYLLQRLDSFTGIALLTTNFGTAIDPAFRRRLSVQVQFPFPDATDRERLWRAHLPASLPTAGDLDLATLAQRYQLSGGYIRNAVLRAAYLAAADSRPLSDDHLRRAITLEYQRAGQLGDGRLE